ncbi:Hypothetical predicted protein [Podarcis lilfordi]|uniref:Uncharacterized protein n=1 Tax=Podarcis lilfordi TaxID=74358 RepID=A0AA35LJJ8_9SAUR|nr:Hypothetical predicted protein [Podarcis lilfordi]
MYNASIASPRSTAGLFLINRRAFLCNLRCSSHYHQSPQQCNPEQRTGAGETEGDASNLLIGGKRRESWMLRTHRPNGMAYLLACLSLNGKAQLKKLLLIFRT